MTRSSDSRQPRIDAAIDGVTRGTARTVTLGAANRRNPQNSSQWLPHAGLSLVVIALAFSAFSAPGSAVAALPVIFAGGLALGLGYVGLSRARRDATDRQDEDMLASIADRLDRRIELLEDSRWALSDNEARYRDLLDTQEDVIVRLGADGRIIFANRSYARMLAKAPADIVGTRHALDVISVDAAPRGGPSPAEQIVTPAGPRWISWTRYDTVDAVSGAAQVQLVGRDVTDLRAVELKLAEARDGAESASRAKSRFLAAMSHEIRTPMNGILGMGGLLLDTQLSVEQQAYARAIDGSARTLLALIDEILDFSRIEADRLVLAEAPFDLHACIEDVIELLAPRAHEKGLEIAWSHGPDLPVTAVGDGARLRQVVLNLVGNAIKFTDRGGIHLCAGVSTGDGGARLHLSVKDTGIGIAPDRLAGLFTEFEQAEHVASRRHGGVGLGLAISRRIVSAMGGNLTVESAPGRGATFTVDAPLCLAAEPATTVAAAAAGSARRPRVALAFDRLVERKAIARILSAHGADVIEVATLDVALAGDESSDGAAVDVLVVDGADDVAEAGRVLGALRARANGHVRGVVLVDATSRAAAKGFLAAGFQGQLVRPVRPRSMLAELARAAAPQSPASTAPAPSAGAATVSAALRQYRVLVAEDNPINALLARTVLEKSGCEAVMVTDGRAAVAAYAASASADAASFDLILMDLHMPGMGGLEAADAIRRTAAADARHTCPPIVALTADAFAEDRARCLAAGFDDYLAKPFERRDLAELTLKWCAGPPPLPRPTGASLRTAGKTSNSGDDWPVRTC